MIPAYYITRKSAFWAGVILLAMGVALAVFAFYSQMRLRNSSHDAERMAEELRANGAIVENYYKVLKSNNHESPHITPPPIRFGGFIMAGILMAAGGILIYRAPSFAYGNL